jgi:hypothetical protein
MHRVGFAQRGGRLVSDRLEFDSDVNEDRNRELELDRSFDNWVAANIENQTRQQEEMTEAPHDNVFDAAEEMDQE